MRLIERDSICRCGACQQASNLGLKFVAHSGMLKEILDPPERPSPVIPVGQDAVELEIDAPLIKVYTRIIDVYGKVQWVVGLDALDHDETTARIEERRTRYFQGMPVDFELVHGELAQGHAVYSETAAFQTLPFQHQQTYRLREHGGSTTLRFEICWGDDPARPTN